MQDKNAHSQITTEVPVSISASQMNVSKPQAEDLRRSKLIKKALIIADILLGIVAITLFATNATSGTGAKTLTNGGFTYTFTFNKAASQVHLSDGTAAYKYANKVVASVKPSTAPELTSCQQISSQWHEAMLVEVAGVTDRVCTPNNTTYVMYFSAQNSRHLFTVTYSDTQTAANEMTTLRSILASVTVSH